MTRATQKEQTTTTLKRNLLNIFRKFYQRNLRLSFLDWEPNLGDKIHHTLLSSATGWSRRNLSLPTEHLFWIRFHQSAKWLSLVCAWPSLCASILVFFSIFKVIVFSMLDEIVFVTDEKWRGEENWKLLLSRSLLHLFFWAWMHTSVFTNSK